MTVEIKPLSEQETGRGISLLVYAASGVGKTSLAKTLPAHDILLVECEGGTAVLHGINLDMIRIPQTLENCKDTFEYLKTQKLKWTNVFFDSASELERFMLIRYAEARGVPSQHEYNACYFKMRDYLRTLRDLRESGHNVIVTALEMPMDVQALHGDTTTKAYPMMGRSIAPEICGLFDLVAHMEIRSDQGHVGERILRLDPTESIMAKDRYGVGRFFEPDLGKLFEAVEITRQPKKPAKRRRPAEPNGSEAPETSGKPAKRRRKRPPQAPQEANGATPPSNP